MCRFEQWLLKLQHTSRSALKLRRSPHHTKKFGTSRNCSPKRLRCLKKVSKSSSFVATVCGISETNMPFPQSEFHVVAQLIDPRSKLSLTRRFYLLSKPPSLPASLSLTNPVFNLDRKLCLICVERGMPTSGWSGLGTPTDLNSRQRV